MVKVIERNTQIPTKKESVCVTADDNQTEIFLSVIEGERTMVKDNVTLGSFTISGIPPVPRGQEACDLTFDLDANGILSVSATQRTTGKKAGITINANTTGRLTESQINSLIDRAEKMKLLYEQEENRVLSLNRLITICSQIRLDIQAMNQQSAENLL